MKNGLFGITRLPNAISKGNCRWIKVGRDLMIYTYDQILDGNNFVEEQHNILY